MEQAVNEMRDVVLGQMREQEKAGKLSKAHGYDHVENVARYAGVFGRYLAGQMGLDPEIVSRYAQMSGWGHDVIRYASQTEAGEDASARLLEVWYESLFSRSMSRDEYQRFVVDIVRNSDRSFSEMQTIYKDDPKALAVALALVAGDKLIEASGPRVLERRTFFVGGERMRNPKDLGAAFEYPRESNLGVLSETFVRLGDVNHVMNYASHPALLKLAQELHSYQYQFYAGLLADVNMSEEEAVEQISNRLRSNPLTEKLAARTEKGGKRLVAEKHLDGTYFEANNLSVLTAAIKSMPANEDLARSSILLVEGFSIPDSPEDAINWYKIAQKNSFTPTFRTWMDAIIAYREGTFADQLLERLQD